MRILPWDGGSVANGGQKGTAIAVGVFDGVHRGHRLLLERLSEAAEEGYEPLVLTFSANPRRFFHPESYPGDLMTLDQKVEALGEAGIDAAIVVPFDAAFAAMPGADFLGILASRFGLAFLVMGENTHIGSGGQLHARGAAELAASMGVGSQIIPALRDGGHVVSSSAIRQAIAEGEMGRAAQLLGRPWELDCTGWERSERGGVPTLVSSAPLQVLPPIGRYAAAGRDGVGREIDLATRGTSVQVSSTDGNGLPERLRFV